jgi:hypothetical protein
MNDRPEQNEFKEIALLYGIEPSFIEQALEDEMDEHLGYPKHAPFGTNSGKSRFSAGIALYGAFRLLRIWNNVPEFFGVFYFLKMMK